MDHVIGNSLGDSVEQQRKTQTHTIYKFTHKKIAGSKGTPAKQWQYDTAHTTAVLQNMGHMRSTLRRDIQSSSISNIPSNS